MHNYTPSSLYKPAQVQELLGITRSVLTYWVDKLKLVTPVDRLPGLNLFSFVNILNLGIIQILTNMGLKASELKATMYLVNKHLGPDWEPIKEIYRERKKRNERPYNLIGLEIHLEWTQKEDTLSIVITDSAAKGTDEDPAIKLVRKMKREKLKGKNTFRAVAMIRVPLNIIVKEIAALTKDKSWGQFYEAGHAKKGRMKPNP
jgi:DNA-binding transcriptional MerR regulator